MPSFTGAQNKMSCLMGNAKQDFLLDGRSKVERSREVDPTGLEEASWAILRKERVFGVRC